ncbi:MAG: SocA family protein [Prevotella sp.]|jgi:uncharacterized phage-associated protein|nr:SocA family protein [Prevotella sp.]
MKTNDEILKIKATALYILKSFTDGVDFIKLFKIMYFAQQENLVKYGRPIFNDTFHALKHGPVPTFLYKCIQALEGRGVQMDVSDMFNKALKVQEAKVFLLEEPDTDELSKAELRILDNAVNKYKDIPSYTLSGKSHDKAWREAYTRAQDDPEKDRISLIEIARAGNANNDIVKYIREKEQLKRTLTL